MPVSYDGLKTHLPIMFSYNDLANDQEIYRLKSVARRNRQEYETAVAWGESLLQRLFEQEASLYSENYLRRQLEALLADIFSREVVLPGLTLARAEKDKVEAYLLGELQRVGGQIKDVPSFSFYEDLIKKGVHEWPRREILPVQTILDNMTRLLRSEKDLKESRSQVVSLSRSVKDLNLVIQQKDREIAELKAQLAKAKSDQETQAKDLSLTKHSLTGMKMFLTEHRWKLVRSAAHAAALEKQLRQVDPANPFLIPSNVERIGATAELRFKREHSAMLHLMFDAEVVAKSARAYGESFQLAPAPVSSQVLNVLERIDSKPAPATVPAAAPMSASAVLSAAAGLAAGSGRDAAGADDGEVDLRGDALADQEHGADREHGDSQAVAPSDNDEHEVRPSGDASGDEAVEQV